MKGSQERYPCWPHQLSHWSFCSIMSDEWAHAMRLISIAGMPLLAIAFGGYAFTRSMEMTARAADAMKVAEVAEEAEVRKAAEADAEREHKAAEERRKAEAERQSIKERKPSVRRDDVRTICAAGFMRDSRGRCMRLGDFGAVRPKTPSPQPYRLHKPD